MLLFLCFMLFCLSVSVPVANHGIWRSFVPVSTTFLLTTTTGNINVRVRPSLDLVCCQVVIFKCWLEVTDWHSRCKATTSTRPRLYCEAGPLVSARQPEDVSTNQSASWKFLPADDFMSEEDSLHLWVLDVVAPLVLHDLLGGGVDESDVEVLLLSDS